MSQKAMSQDVQNCDLQIKPKSAQKELLTILNALKKEKSVICECYCGNKLSKPMISWAVSLTMKLMRQLYDKSNGLGPFNIKTKIDEITHPESFCLILKKLKPCQATNQSKINKENENNDNTDEKNSSKSMSNNDSENRNDNNNNNNNNNNNSFDLIGYLSFRIEYESNWECNELYIYEIMMDPKYSQQGFGTYLMKLCEFIGLHKKCKQIGLTCFSTAKAIKFYEKLGYIPDKYSEQHENIDISDYRLLMKLLST